MDDQREVKVGLYQIVAYWPWQPKIDERLSTWDEAKARFDQLRNENQVEAIYLYIDGKLDLSWEDSYFGMGLQDEDDDDEEDRDWDDEDDF